MFQLFFLILKISSRNNLTKFDLKKIFLCYLNLWCLDPRKWHAVSLEGIHTFFCAFDTHSKSETAQNFTTRGSHPLWVYGVHHMYVRVYTTDENERISDSHVLRWWANLTHSLRMLFWFFAKFNVARYFCWPCVVLSFIHFGMQSFG